MSPSAFSDPKEIELRAKWLEQVKKDDQVVYLGGTIPPIPDMAKTIFADGTTKTGAFSEVAHFLTGFLIVQAPDLEAATAIAQSNPILVAGGSVEIREILLR